MTLGGDLSEPHRDERVEGARVSVTRQGMALIRDVVRTGGERFWGGAVLAVAAAASEGLGIFLLPPLLRMAGIVASDGGGVGPRTVAGHAVGLGTVLIGYVLLMAMVGGLLYAHTLVSASLTLRYGDALRRRVHAAVMSMRWSAVARYRSADFTHAMTAEVGQCSLAVRLFLRGLAYMVYAPILLSASVALSPPFTLAVVALSVAIAATMLPLTRRAHGLAEEAVRANRALHGEISDELAGLRSLKILRAEELRGGAFRARADRLVFLWFSQERASAAASQVQKFLIAAAVAVGVWAGWSILHVSVPELLALVLLYGRTMMAMSRLQDLGRQLVRVLPAHAALRRRLAACRAEAEPEPVGAPPSLRRVLRLEGVSFRPGEGCSALLSDVDIEIPAFAVTALVGPSGAGKSTLADLAMGLTEPSTGCVSIDGVALDGGTRVAWRRHVGYVPQEAFLFHDTLRANLLLARPDADDADLWRVLTLASADEFVRNLPDGLDTVVGDRGGRLSGGERQRVVLARALLSDPELLILDEATGALDSGMERRILDGLSALRGRLTLLLITHREAALAYADHIVRLEAGRVVRGRNDLSHGDAWSFREGDL